MGSELVKYRVVADLDYVGQGNPRQMLDLHLPQMGEASGAKVPVVLYFHGGAWAHGSKEHAAQRVARFYGLGCAWAAVNYRLIDEVTWPAMIDDAVAALRWVREHADEWKIDAQRVAVFGSSSGAHLACLLAGGCRQGNKVERLKLRAVVNYCAPVLISDYLAGAVLEMLGKEPAGLIARAREATVTEWVSPEYPRMLVLHGDQDDVVPLEQSEVLYRACQAQGVDCELHVVKGAGHRLENPEVIERVQAFLRDVLR